MADASVPLTYLLARPSYRSYRDVRLAAASGHVARRPARQVAIRTGLAHRWDARGAFFVTAAAVVVAWPLAAVLAWLLVWSGPA